MSIETNNAPAWYSKEELECFEKIRELARTFSSATALVVEREGDISVLIECTETPSSDENWEISQFNNWKNPLLLDYVEESEQVEGKRYPLQ